MKQGIVKLQQPAATDIARTQPLKSEGFDPCEGPPQICDTKYPFGHQAWYNRTAARRAAHLLVNLNDNALLVWVPPLALHLLIDEVQQRSLPACEQYLEQKL